LYILIFMFLDSKREENGSGLNGSKHYSNSIPSKFCSWIRFWFVTVFFQISELHHIFKTSVSYFYVVTLPLFSDDETATYT
jgi:hypothetical protein